MQKSFRGEHMKYVTISFVIVLAAATLLISAIFTNILQKQNVQKMDWHVISLPEEFEWEERNVTVFDGDIEEARIFIDPEIRDGSIENAWSGTPTLPGKLYTTVVTDEHESYQLAGYELGQQLYETVHNNGWAESVEFNNRKISGWSADGVQSGIVGFIKLNGTEVRAITYSYELNGNWVMDVTPNRECPCETQMSIFISDPYDLSDFSALYE